MKNYRILFLGYWNLDDGLTYSTIFPHLQILKELPQVEYLHFANTQREALGQASLKIIDKLGIDYSPLYSTNLSVNQLNKVYDFIHFPALIKKLCQQHGINFIIARGAPAGSLAYLVWKKLKIPFIVESFEPHADYMRAAGVWKASDLRYLFQKHWEKQQKKYAYALITVAENYKEYLIKAGILETKLFVASCAVDQNVFFKDENIRIEMRKKHQIRNNETVGVYAGKFGGLYLEEGAFVIFRQCFDQIEDFHLLLLTNSDVKWINQQIASHQLPSNRIHIKFVPYQEVNKYLNMADFAFALYKSNKVSPYLSPVKIGEYWAAGLPVAITPNLGDEQHFITEKSLGVVIGSTDWIYNLQRLIKEPISIGNLRNLASTQTAYETVLG